MNFENYQTYANDGSSNKCNIQHLYIYIVANTYSIVKI